MTPIFSNNIKNVKAISKTLQTFLLHKKNIYRENPISIGWNAVKLQLIKEIQISRHMTIYRQNLGVFKRENNECSLNGEKTKLHKIKIVVFLSLACVVYEAYFFTNYVLRRHIDVIRDEIRVIDQTS